MLWIQGPCVRHRTLSAFPIFREYQEQNNKIWHNPTFSDICFDLEKFLVILTTSGPKQAVQIVRLSLFSQTRALPMRPSVQQKFEIISGKTTLPTKNVKFYGLIFCNLLHFISNWTNIEKKQKLEINWRIVVCYLWTEQTA